MSISLRILLRPFSLVYRIAVFIWNLYWRNAKQVKLPCKVISVGNIVAGGTGKTPIVVYLANLASNLGLKTAVISRGYKRSGTGLVELNRNSNWLDVGDEPLEIFRRTDNVRVYVCKSKTEAAIKAASEGAELIIIDDGFQHRRLARDIDIVCLDWTNPLGPGGYLPYGLLREPPKALIRADIIIYTSYRNKSNQEKQVKGPIGRISLFWSSSHITGFKSLNSDKRASIDQISKERAIAFCGLGSPEKFEECLKQVNIRPAKFIRFRDHHHYTQDNIDKLKQTALEQKASIFITTFKDAVKIELLDFGKFDVYSAMLEIEIIDQFGKQQGDEFKARLGL
jgi:tetraacyldisaccharide 4'-kinase